MSESSPKRTSVFQQHIYHEHRRLEMELARAQLTAIASGLGHDDVRILVRLEETLEPRATVAREAQHGAAVAMKRHREEGSSGDGDADAGAARARASSPSSPTRDTVQSASNSAGTIQTAADCDNKSDDSSVEVLCLTDNADAVKQVKKLNLGVLPVQCPEFCYRRALRDEYRLSWAVTVRKNSNDAGSDSERANEAIAGGIIAEYEALNKVVHIRTLAVEPRYRRQGIGHRLIRQIIHQTQGNLIQQEGQRVDSIRLHVHVGNDDGIAFYKSVGFKEEARLEDYYRHLEPRACLVLSYALSKPNVDEQKGGNE